MTLEPGRTVDHEAFVTVSDQIHVAIAAATAVHRVLEIAIVERDAATVIEVHAVR